MNKSPNPLRERTAGLFLILWMRVTLPVFGLGTDTFHLTDRDALYESAEAAGKLSKNLDIL